MVELEGTSLLWATKNTTINSVYCEQLQKLSDAIVQKCSELINRKGVMFHHDNARLYTVWSLGKNCCNMVGMCYHIHRIVQDLASSDFHLFRFLQNSLNSKTFASEDFIKQHLDKFLAEKDGKFYERDIMKLPGRLQKVIEQNGQYIID